MGELIGGLIYIGTILGGLTGGTAFGLWAEGNMGRVSHNARMVKQHCRHTLGKKPAIQNKCYQLAWKNPKVKCKMIVPGKRNSCKDFNNENQD